MCHKPNGIKLQIKLPHEIAKEPIDPKFSNMFMGGLGFNTKILYDEVGPSVDPLGPDNIVVISPGALNGTGAPTTCRTELSTKSPLTGIFGTGNFGGYWGQALKNAGYETITIRGMSPKPVYLLVDDKKVEIRDASHIWGTDCWNTDDILKEELGEDFIVLTIGQAGENLVRYSTVIVDREHAPGRSHVGAVLGAKKLKAIAVRGTNRTTIKSPNEFESAVRETTERIENFPGWNVKLIQMIDAILPDYTESAEHYLIDGGYGFFCPCILGTYFGCNLIAEINEGKYVGTRVSVGSTQGAYMARNLGVSLRAAFKLRELCHRYGLDYWEEPLVYFMTLFEKGIITRADTDGLDLKKGNESAFIEILGKIANRKGFGDVIAEGTERASRIIGRGSEKYLSTLKGMEFFGDPRTFTPNKYLSYQINPRGGDDLKGTHGVIAFPGMPLWAHRLNWNENMYLEWLLERHDMFDDVKEAVFGSPPNLYDLDSAMLVKWYNDLSCVYDSLGFCMFSDSFQVMGPTLYARLYSAVTGQSITPVELMVRGERIFNLMRVYNLREGMRREHDDWPHRFYVQPLKHGDETYTLSKEIVDQLLSRYYELRGWDEKTGVPSEGKLRQLQLHQVADELLNYTK